jgi:hypothetical protein
MAKADGRKPLRVSETYCHFDTLIWQVPSIGMAVGVGAVIGAAQIEKVEGWVLSLAQVRGLVLFLGAVLMMALSVAY